MSSQYIPFPVYPASQEHTTSPLLFVQVALEWHPPLFVSHGLIISAFIGTDVFTPRLLRSPFATADPTWDEI
jgi:hypothetical protein